MDIDGHMDVWKMDFRTMEFWTPGHTSGWTNGQKVGLLAHYAEAGTTMDT